MVPIRHMTLFAVILFFTACSHKLAPEGHFQGTPVVADGNTDDWSLPLRFSDVNYTFQYNITNDSKNIYVCVTSADETTQLRILRSGMALYFDPKGNKKKEISIHFPTRKQPDPSSYRNRNGNPITNGDNKTRKEEMLLQSNYYNTTGFHDIENGQFGVDNPQSPLRVSIRMKGDSLLVYEAVIPLKYIPGCDLATRSSRKNFSMGVALESAPARPGEGGPPGRPGGAGRGMGMGLRMGGMGGRRYGGSGASNNPGLKEEDNWYVFRLVSK